MCLFFFSSRRRHTRWPRDWSSDVCSSDLQLLELVKNALVGGHDELGVRQLLGCSDDLGGGTHVVGQIDDRSRRFGRSEERRVGKECRARWWTYRSGQRREKDTIEERR